MAGQKFAVGQFVEFDKSATPAFKPIGPYEVVRVQPADDLAVARVSHQEQGRTVRAQCQGIRDPRHTPDPGRVAGPAKRTLTG